MITKCEKNGIVKNGCIISLFRIAFFFLSNYDNKSCNYQKMTACLPYFLAAKIFVTDCRNEWIFVQIVSLNPAKKCKVVKLQLTLQFVQLPTKRRGL